MTHAVISRDHQLVMIEWLDSFGVGPAWEPIYDETELKLPVCVSVGYVVKENDSAICVVPHVFPADEEIGAVKSGCGDMTIPRAAIVRTVNLQTAE